MKSAQEAAAARAGGGGDAWIRSQTPGQLSHGFSMEGLVEQIKGNAVFVRLVDGQAWRFGLKQFEEVTTPHNWQGEVVWD